MTLSRRVTEEDLRYKGLPFECDNCGNKPTPQDVVGRTGSCSLCGDSIVAYTVDTAEFILSLQAERDALKAALVEIAAQKETEELVCEGSIVYGYDTIIKIARKALEGGE